MELTGVVQSGGDARDGPVGTELGHAAVSLDGERVVQMRIQVTNDDRGVPQVCRTWLETDLLATGDTHGLLAVLAHHTVSEVTAAPGHQRWAPEQLQPALCRQGGGGQVTRGTGWGFGEEGTEQSA